MTTHDHLQLPWPEGATWANVFYHDAAGCNLGGGEPIVVERPPAPAPAGWCGPEGSDWHDYVGRYGMALDVGGCRVIKLHNYDPHRGWVSENDIAWPRFRPLTAAEAGVVTP